MQRSPIALQWLGKLAVQILKDGPSCVDREHGLVFAQKFFIGVRQARIVAHGIETVDHIAQRPQNIVHRVRLAAQVAQAWMLVPEQLEQAGDGRAGGGVNALGVTDCFEVSMKRRVDAINRMRGASTLDQRVGVSQCVLQHLACDRRAARLHGSPSAHRLAICSNWR